MATLPYAPCLGRIGVPLICWPALSNCHRHSRLSPNSLLASTIPSFIVGALAGLRETVYTQHPSFIGHYWNQNIILSIISIIIVIEDRLCYQRILDREEGAHPRRDLLQDLTQGHPVNLAQPTIRTIQDTPGVAQRIVAPLVKSVHSVQLGVYPLVMRAIMARHHRCRLCLVRDSKQVHLVLSLRDLWHP